jgi:hypothetical protein
MRRPSAAREALGFSPLMKAGGADATCVERVPLVAAGAEPFVFLPGRPAAEWALDARRFRLAGLLIVQKLPVWNDNRIVRDRTHARYYDLRPDYLSSVRRFTEALAQHQPYSAATAYSAL